VSESAAKVIFRNLFIYIVHLLLVVALGWHFFHAFPVGSGMKDVFEPVWVEGVSTRSPAESGSRHPLVLGSSSRAS
jgi:hypothetical protein